VRCTAGSAWDSGAPVVLVADDPASDFLVALGSSGVSCADLVFPAIQARVSTGYPWIRAQVCTLSINPPLDFQCDDWHASIAQASNSTNAPGPETMSPMFRNQEIFSFASPDLVQGAPGSIASLTCVAVGILAMYGVVRRIVQLRQSAKREYTVIRDIDV
jgi:hypothetical protein